MSHTFLLRVDIHADTSAVGWRRVDGVWDISQEETDRATREMMFAQGEEEDPKPERCVSRR